MKSTHMPFWSLIQKSALGVLGIIIAAMGTLGWSYSRYAADNREQLENVSKERVAKRRLFSLIEELAAIQLASDSYLQLREQGVLGELNKTRLLDRVEAALIPFGEAVVDYKLEGYKPFTRPMLAELSRHQFGMHRLQLNFKPIHELEFVDIWRSLASSSEGVSPVESCELSRKDSGVDSSAPVEAAAARQSTDTAPTIARLEARCVLTAYSIRVQADNTPMAGSSISANGAAAPVQAMAPVRTQSPGSR